MAYCTQLDSAGNKRKKRLIPGNRLQWMFGGLCRLRTRLAGQHRCGRAENSEYEYQNVAGKEHR
jgi:hypothetical protein